MRSIDESIEREEELWERVCNGRVTLERIFRINFRVVRRIGVIRFIETAPVKKKFGE